MNPVFDFTRLGFFIRRQLYMNMGALWISLAAVVGAMLIISALFAYFNPQDTDTLLGLRNMYLVVFMIGGYMFTSNVYHEMNSPQKSFTFLTLPVSATERLVGAWIISSPVYIVVYAACMALLGFISCAIAKQPDYFPALFDRPVLICVQVFLVTQTLFFLGACTFKGYNFLKTLLTIIVVGMALAAYSGGLGYLLFGNRGVKVGPTGEFKETAEFIFTKVIPFIFWYLLAPFLLVVSYFKLKERQV
ncbi:hypothetical protein [Pontibacter sp. SGAir0037]|uniref:hypothetical protein n=1 Tax=Pontibacter sp. SGAir0037 TaxID=2571030 RepID=UPI0010CD099B|nr:hypothetical protein [Pontibacter sp. SGAir0037]QCR23834.1 hypothetical protein C1N53_16755 [Pontibacter sp. SGAir0037]